MRAPSLSGLLTGGIDVNGAISTAQITVALNASPAMKKVFFKSFSLRFELGVTHVSRWRVFQVVSKGTSKGDDRSRSTVYRCAPPRTRPPAPPDTLDFALFECDKWLDRSVCCVIKIKR